TKKFKKFLTDNGGDSVWDKEDDLFRMRREVLPRREDFQRTLSKIYEARSKATHRGQQFPASSSYSGGPTMPVRVATALYWSNSPFPPVVWFQRIANPAIRNFWEHAVGALPPEPPPSEAAVQQVQEEDETIKASKARPDRPVKLKALIYGAEEGGFWAKV